MSPPIFDPAVRIVEVGPRDGLQNIASHVPTSVKVELIQRLVKAGLSTVEATSFVSPKWIPQLADNREVLRSIEPLLRDGTLSLPVLVPNVRGLDDALQHKVKEVAVFVSASEGFSRRNTNCSVGEALARAREVATRARQHGVAVRGYVSCIIECPYDGPTPPAAVLRVTRELLAMGCYEVSLGDTLGTATPSLLRNLLADHLLAPSNSFSSSSSPSTTTSTTSSGEECGGGGGIPATRLAGHFHDTHGRALANVLAAYDLGLRTFDSSVAGLGGCPYAGGRAPGNVATEDVVHAFERRGIATGVCLGELVGAGRWISAALGVPNRSRAGAALAGWGRPPVAREDSPEVEMVEMEEMEVEVDLVKVVEVMAEGSGEAVTAVRAGGWELTEQATLDQSGRCATL